MEKFETNSSCPYCEKVAVPPPPKRATHLHVQCTECKLTPLAVFVDTVTGTRVYYVKENQKRYTARNVRWEPWQAEWIAEHGSAAARNALKIGINALKCNTAQLKR